MFHWLKKHFIPHEGNEHRPHILRDSSIQNIVIAVILLEIFTFLIPTFTRLNISGGMAAVLPAVLADLTNQERKADNLQVLTVSPILNKAAEMKAEDMATNGYFAHTSPTGKTPWYWLDQVGYNYQYAGENLAINFTDSIDVTNAWMNSPTHKANIVKENYTEIGTGIASGLYQGRETVFVAQIYANPFVAPVKQIVPAKTNTNTKSKTPSVATGKESTNVLGAQTIALTEQNASNVLVNPIQNPTFWQKLLASPRNTTNIILFVVFGIIAVALLLYLFIKMKNYHLRLITNGLIVLAIVGAIFIANYYLSYRGMFTTQSLDYSKENK